MLTTKQTPLMRPCVCVYLSVDGSIHVSYTLTGIFSLNFTKNLLSECQGVAVRDFTQRKLIMHTTWLWKVIHVSFCLKLH